MVAWRFAYVLSAYEKFGLSFTGSSSNCADILNEMVRVFESFRSDLNEVDLNRAKNMLKRQILLNVSNQMDRMEEVVRTVSFFVIKFLINLFFSIQSIKILQLLIIISIWLIQ